MPENLANSKMAPASHNPADASQPTPRGLIAIFGVSGSGKSTLGKRVAERLGIPFLDADDLHPASNREKMSAGIPLQDTDRRPWLERINRACRERLQDAPALVLAVPGHKEAYRRMAARGISPVRWYLLDGDRDLIHRRMCERDHFMPPALLDSQLAILEPPDYARRLDIARPLDELAEIIISDQRLTSGP